MLFTNESLNQSKNISLLKPNHSLSRILRELSRLYYVRDDQDRPVNEKDDLEEVLIRIVCLRKRM